MNSGDFVNMWVNGEIVHGEVIAVISTSGEDVLLVNVSGTVELGTFTVPASACEKEFHGFC